MNTSAPNEDQMKEALAEMTKATVTCLQRLFPTPPAGKSWEEIEAAMAQGKSLREICGVTGERMEGIYEEAKRKLEREDFEGAKELFASHCLYEQQAPKYWGRLAKACEGLQYYDEAVGCHRMMALVTGGTELLPYLGMGYCHLALSDKKRALEALEIGREVAGSDGDRSRLTLWTRFSASAGNKGLMRGIAETDLDTGQYDTSCRALRSLPLNGFHF